MTDINLELFKQMSLFWGMNNTELKMFCDSANIEKFSARDIIFQEKDECEKFYIVIKGSVEIITTLEDGSTKTLGLVYPGGHFGEMALIDDAPRAATAMAAEYTEALCIVRDKFLDLIEKNPTFAAKALINLARTLSKNLRKTNALVRDTIDWNLKISGAMELNLGKMLQESREIRIRVTGQDEIKCILLRVEKDILGQQVVVQDITGQIFFIPINSIVYIATSVDNTTKLPMHF